MHFADKTPHIVLSKTLDEVAGKTTRIVRDVEEIRNMKLHPGKDKYAVGGATLVSSLMNPDSIDELRRVVHPDSLKSLAHLTDYWLPDGLIGATACSNSSGGRSPRAE